MLPKLRELRNLGSYDSQHMVSKWKLTKTFLARHQLFIHIYFVSETNKNMLQGQAGFINLGWMCCSKKQNLSRCLEISSFYDHPRLSPPTFITGWANQNNPGDHIYSAWQVRPRLLLFLWQHTAHNWFWNIPTNSKKKCLLTLRSPTSHQ